MPIDTREKRQAAASISMYWIGPSVTPNVAKDLEWRQEGAWAYPQAAAVPAGPPVGSLAQMGCGR